MFEQRTSKGSIEKWGQKIAYSAVTTSSTCPILGWRLIFIWSSQISEFFKVTLLSRNPLKNQFVQQIYCPYANFNLKSTVRTFKNEKNNLCNTIQGTSTKEVKKGRQVRWDLKKFKKKRRNS